MGKIQEVKELIKGLFDSVSDETTIKSYGVIENKLSEIEAETIQKTQDYNNLLKDYKEVVIHGTTVKQDPNNPINNGSSGGRSTVESRIDAALRNIIAKSKEK